MAETEEETASRSQMWKHEDFVEWATDEGLLDPRADQATTIAVFAANRNAYRKTERYRDLIESHREEAAQAKADAAAARKEAAAKKAAEKEKAAKAAPKEKPAPAKAAAKKTTTRRSTKASEDNPFDD